MNHFSLHVPAAQVVLDNHERTRTLLEVANRAVLDAVLVYTDFLEAEPTVVFGCREACIHSFAKMDQGAMGSMFGCGMPIFDLRVATRDFVDALARGTDDAFRVLVESFASGAPITYIDGLEPLSATSAMLNANARVRQKVEAANTAILDAVKAFIECCDPMASYIFGASTAVLQGLAETSRAKMLGILMTSVPIFTLREPLCSGKSDDAIEDTDDAALMQLLKSFSVSLQAD